MSEAINRRVLLAREVLQRMLATFHLKWSRKAEDDGSGILKTFRQFSPAAAA